jgi:signal transduction histidine kinase
MRFEELRRTTTFRLTVLYGLLFAIGTVALLSMVYLRSAVYLTRRVDGILNTEADALMRSARAGLRARVDEELLLNGARTNVFALFAPDGARLAGNLAVLPAGLRMTGGPLEVPPTAQFPASARLIAHRLATGEILVVGRDVSQLQEMRRIIFAALIWSGIAILTLGLACGIAFSVAPLKRLQRLQAAANDIAAGNLQRRMPTTQRRDELDMFATTVNYMLSEVARLMAEVRSATAVGAHDLLNPLSTAVSQLRRLEHAQAVRGEELAQITDRIDAVLGRFRAILRIAELEARQRRAGFERVELGRLIADVGALYAPLAEDAGVRLLTIADDCMAIEADPKLLFEALSNLVDNAIKFAGRGSTVMVRLGKDPTRPQLIVQDDGPGIAPGERPAVLQRFYRAERNRDTPGLGLGLSVVSAIVRLHGFQLLLEDAEPGLRAVIEAWPSPAVA